MIKGNLLARITHTSHSASGNFGVTEMKINAFKKRGMWYYFSNHSWARIHEHYVCSG